MLEKTPFQRGFETTLGVIVAIELALLTETLTIIVGMTGISLITSLVAVSVR